MTRHPFDPEAEDLPTELALFPLTGALLLPRGGDRASMTTGIRMLWLNALASLPRLRTLATTLSRRLRLQLLCRMS